MAAGIYRPALECTVLWWVRSLCAHRHLSTADHCIEHQPLSHHNRPQQEVSNRDASDALASRVNFQGNPKP